jgi:hypothetical protein
MAAAMSKPKKLKYPAIAEWDEGDRLEFAEAVAGFNLYVRLARNTAIDMEDRNECARLMVLELDKMSRLTGADYDYKTDAAGNIYMPLLGMTVPLATFKRSAEQLRHEAARARLLGEEYAPRPLLQSYKDVQ